MFVFLRIYMDVWQLKPLLNYLVCINCAVGVVGIYKLVMHRVVLVFMMVLIGLLDNWLLLVSMISTNIMIFKPHISENIWIALNCIHNLFFLVFNTSIYIIFQLYVLLFVEIASTFQFLLLLLFCFSINFRISCWKIV